MKYAVISLAGKQYKVSERDEILVDKISEVPKTDVILFVDGETVLVGKPTVKNCEVTLKLKGSEKGDKIYTQKFKAKSRYSKKIGFRPSYSRLLVEKISVKN